MAVAAEKKEFSRNWTAFLAKVEERKHQSKTFLKIYNRFGKFVVN